MLTEDEMLNLEVALSARSAAEQAGRELGVVVRAYDQRLSRNLAALLPGAKVLAAYELAGEAFAAAAFGETIAGLFRLHDHTILVAEYAVREGDGLCGRLLAQVGHGFGVVPVALRRAATSAESAESADDLDLVFPPDGVRLKAGDRLTVLASINGLRRIERDQIVPPRRWRAHGSPPIVKDFLHFAGNTLSRVSGLPLADARAFMESLPGAIELDLYDAQARRLVNELRHQMELRLEPVAVGTQGPVAGAPS